MRIQASQVFLHVATGPYGLVRFARRSFIIIFMRAFC